MNKAIFPGAALSAICIISILSGCGKGLESDTWLITLGIDTITVADAGEAWSELSPGEQNHFLQKNNHVDEFIISFSGKQMIINEISRLDYLSKPDIIALGNAWTRRQSAMLARENIMAETEAGITDEDITYFMDHMGTIVWYTISPGSAAERSFGPVHLPLLRRELAVHLDSMSQGDELPLSDGTIIRHDSITVTDPVLIHETLQDSARVSTFAFQKFSSAWGEDNIHIIADSILAAAESEIRNPSIDRLASYYSGHETLHPEDTVAVSCSGILTTLDFVLEIQYQSAFNPVQPSNPTWLTWFVKQTLFTDALAHYLASNSPEAYDSILMDRNDWMLSKASDKLFTDEVINLVDVTPEMILSEFENLTEIPFIPEKRSIQCIQIVNENIGEFKAAMLSGEGMDSLISSCGFWALLSDEDPPSSITRPLFQDEIPGNIGEEVFAVDPGDTLIWSDLFRLVEDYSSVAFMLLKVYPTHEASFEEIEGYLDQMIRTELEEEKTEEWLFELEEFYDLKINEEILPSLPSDPSLWTTL